MKKMKWMLSLAAIAAIGSPLAPPPQASLFKVDFAANQNDADGVTLTNWDTVATWTFADFTDGKATWKLTDFSADKDNDVTLTITDNEDLSAQMGWDPPTGMTGNNPTHEDLEVVYDTITVPPTVKDDYLYRAPDTAGSELLFRFANLNPGKYNVTVFEGRTTDANGQYGKIWVDDVTGKKEPAEANTGDFAGTHLEDGARVVDPGGNPKTISVDISAGDYLWYAHMEDNSGGISGIIIRSVAALVDTDKDGIPDDWETQYGLNLNDPSDAAKDCNNNGVTNLDEYKADLDPCDATPPTVIATSGSGTMDAMKLTFSETLEITGATNTANYTITPALAVTAASYNNKVVTLTTATQTVGTAYTVALKGIRDLSKNEVPAGTTATVNSYVLGREGVLKFSYWGDATGGDQIAGAGVQGLLDDPRYPASPSLVLPVYSFNSRDAFPNDTHELYGATIEGYLTPKETAQFRFFIYSDDASQLLLSTDDKEANLAQVAEETGCCNVFTEPDSPRTSEPISLTAGKKYFIRLIYKEGGGGDYGQVAWRKEGDTTAANKLKPIPAEFLSSAADLPIPPVSRELLDFQFNEGNGTSITDAASKLVGTFGATTNAPSWTSNGPSGQAGDHALSFGTNQQVVVQDPDTKVKLDSADPSFTMQAWVNLQGNPTTRQVFYFNNGPGGALSFSIFTNRTLFVTTLGVKDQSSNAKIPDDGKWHHVAVVHEDKKEFRFYVDGALADTQAYTGGVLFSRTNMVFYIGSEPTFGLQYTGQLDRLKVTKGMLTPEQLDSKSGAVAGPALAISRAATGISVTFEGTLEGADNVNGPWSAVPGNSPLAVTPTATAKFYRAKQ